MALIETEALRHSYRDGGATRLGRRRHQPGHRTWRVRRRDRTLGLGQVHLPEPHGLSRHADRRPLPAGRDGCRGLDRDALAAIRNRSSASCSRRSICCRAPARSKTSSCRCSIAGMAPPTPPPRPGAAGRDGPARPRRPYAGGAVGRAAAARRDRPRARRPSRWCCWPTSRPAPSTARQAGRSWRSFGGSIEKGLTIVLVTHEAEIAAHAGRVINFRDGRVVGDGARPPQPALRTSGCIR